MRKKLATILANVSMAAFNALGFDSEIFIIRYIEGGTKERMAAFYGQHRGFRRLHDLDDVAHIVMEDPVSVGKFLKEYRANH